MARNRRRIDQDERRTRRTSLVRSVGGTIARLLGALALTAVVLGGAVAGYAWMRSSPTFEVREITVAGTRLSDPTELQKRAALVTGVNIFSVDLASAARAIELEPWVLRARVARELPAALRVVVEERMPVALIAVDDLYAVDTEGVLFKRATSADPIDLPVITGLTRDALLGEKRRDADLRGALDLVKAWETSDVGSRLPLAEVNVGTEGGETSYTAYCDEDPVLEVRLGVLGDGVLAETMDRLVRVSGELARRGVRARSIDLGNRQRPDWVAARLDQPAPKGGRER